MDEEIVLTKGDWIKTSLSANREFFASSNKGISYVWLQIKENSLGGYIR